jgi:3-oxoadipate enol-lactonase
VTDIKSGPVRHVAAGQVRLAYRTWGPAQAPPLVLLHALGDDSSDWAPVATALSPSWRVYAPDLRGHGASDWPGTYTIEQLSTDLAAFLDALGLEHVALGGHSIGAVPAFLLAARQADRVTRLVLEDPAPPWPRARWVRDRPEGPLSFDWGATALSNEFTAAQVSPWRDSLRRIQAPALLIAGGPASHVDQGQLADMAGLIPGCELVTILAGHLVHAARPADFTAAVSAFLDQPRLGTSRPRAPSPEGPPGRRLASHRAPGRTYGNGVAQRTAPLINGIWPRDPSMPP